MYIDCRFYVEYFEFFSIKAYKIELVSIDKVYYVSMASEADAYELNKLYDQWKSQHQPKTSEYENYSEQLELPIGDKQETQAQKWKAEGRCPQCGELGVFINLGMTCSKHGSY